ncbi:GNAT family N-acetyltransferase [Enterococcus sp. BWT-B8]|uniref:GNAT family N-acetyltransferase n=1 Tax=Enterococcus sp. BWT-B8 TaxID=2885157 RepID=UPI001E61663C|nr:GNAT family N-acetyltransferase [Enterococcus sp. BWT-B8]MCB5952288.1 GNAT family N-acetyltransferase [Enterococcus sp. BWT-B8]
MKIVHTKDTMSDMYLDALHIRHQVFMIEQGVPKDIEIDKYEAACIHFILYQENQAIATCRLLPLENNTVKLQRMAVLKPYRGKHFGKLLIEGVEDFAKKQGFHTITLGAQATALDFYKKLGYTKHGEEFLDADIPHFQMDKVL